MVVSDKSITDIVSKLKCGKHAGPDRISAECFRIISLMVHRYCFSKCVTQMCYTNVLLKMYYTNVLLKMLICNLKHLERM